MHWLPLITLPSVIAPVGQASIHLATAAAIIFGNGIVVFQFYNQR